MKKLLVPILVLVLISANPAFGHKLISHEDNHRNFEQALEIPDHKISWAIYEELGAKEAKYYRFSAVHGDSFYASIVIPKIAGLEEYSPTMALVGTGVQANDSIPIQMEAMGVEKIEYQGNFPGREFYEPFGQVTYWERQEFSTIIPMDGEYYIIVYDEKNQSGKYSLAIGTIEDFALVDFFTVLPKAWFDTKIFVNDYVSITILFAIFISIATIIVLKMIRKKKSKINVSLH